MATSASAQRIDSLAQQDSVQKQAIKEQGDILNRKADTARAVTPAIYDKAKMASHRSKFLNAMYRLIFREPANPLKVSKKKEDNLNNKYRRLNGRVIRRIIIKPLDVWGPKVFDTLAQTRNFAERLGNAVHATTKRYIIRNQLSFSPGDKFKSSLISNNERILRETPYIVDARILPLATGSKDSVDLLVITQDIFSINGSVSVGGIDRYAADLTDINLLGLNHTARFRYEYNGSLNHPSKLQGYYLIPYILKKSFISAEAEGINSNNLYLARARVFKDFLFTTTRWAGSAELLTQRYTPLLFNPDDNTPIPSTFVGYREFDGWLGRAFPINSGNPSIDERVRLIVSGRVQLLEFFQGPKATLDSNQIFRDRRLVLFAFGYSDRDYFRDVLINGYGRTEDVPYGISFTLTGGVESNPFSTRKYGGVRYSQAKYLPNAGYFRVQAEAGSYLDFSRPQQGLIRTEAFYYSPLASIGKLNLRQFIRLRYTEGFNRFQNEFLSINNRNGLTGLSSQQFLGTKAVTLNLETVFFFNFDILSFKTAPFADVDLGWVNFGTNLFDRTPYTGFGAGLRLYNERLTIQTFQIRLAWYPNVPNINNPFRTNFARGTPVNLSDFSINEPQVLEISP